VRLKNSPCLYKKINLLKYLFYSFLFSSLFSIETTYACPGNAGFTISTPYCTNAAIAFTNTSTGGPLTYSWNFGDPGSGGNNTSVLTNPTHVFSTFGWFTICLVAHYAGNCTDTLCQTIAVIQGPTAGYTWTPNNQCATTPVSFTSTSTGAISYQWNFGDPLSLGNNNSTIPNPVHTFTATGGGTQTYIVSLTVTGNGGCTNSIAQTITVLQKPDASVADLLTNFNNCTSATSGNPAFSLTVTNTSSTQGTNTHYHIDWGDGTAQFDTAGDYVNTPHTYANLGIYFLISTVTGANGCIAVDTFRVLNISNPSIGMSSLGGTAGCGPVTYCFPISSFQNNDTSTLYKFNFGDGTPIVIYHHPPPDTVCHTYDSTSCASPGSQFVATVTAVDACDSTQSTVNNIKVFMAAIPVFTVGPDTVGCVNQAFTFTNSSVSGFNNVCNTSATFTWDFGDGSPVVITNNTGPQTHTYTFTGLFTVTLTASNYCNANAIDSVHVCVNAPPIMNFTVDNLTGCAPLNVQSNNTTTSANVCGPTNYLWAITYNGSICNPMTGTWSYQIGSDSASVNPAYTFTDPGSYTISLTANNGCIVPPDTLSILVKTIPTVVITPILDTCGTATVFPSATYVNCYGVTETYNWSFPGGNPNSSNLQNPPAVFYGGPGNYTITASSTNECGTFDTTTSFNVNPLPNVNVIASSDSICSGQSTTLTATGAVTYTWAPPLGLNTTVGPVVIATPATTTTYTATGISGANCTDTQSITITVTPSPIVTVGASATNICIGNSSTLTANGANTYTWSPATGLNTTTGAIVIASPLTTTTYTVVGTSGNGCMDSSTVTIIVHPLPTITVNPPNPSTCIGDSVVLTASGAAFYSWAPNTGLNTTVGSTVTASPPATTTYTITGTTGLGCVNTTTVTVTINTLPIVVVSASNNSICIGSSTTLSATGANTYTWTPNVNLSSNTGTPITASPTSTITYTCTGSSGVGCVATDSVTITVNPLPIINVNTVSPTICVGSSTNITATGAVNYTWAPGTGLNTTVGAMVTANPITTTTYIITGTDANGCVNTDSITITVNPLPIVNVSSQFGSICAGSSTTLTATGANTYAWTPPTGLNSTTGAIVTATINTTTTYTVTGTDGNGCMNSANVTVTVFPLPNVVATAVNPSICFGQITTLNATGANSYTWTPTNSLSSGTGSSVISDPTTTTTYTVTGTDGNGCVNTNTVTVTVNPLPTITVNAVSSGICFGDSTQLNAGGGVTYTWAPTTGLSSSTGASVYAQPAITTTYTVTGTDANGCVNTSAVTVTVHPLPTIDITASVNPICNGQSTILTATGANTYSWTPNTGLNTTVGAIVTASPNTSINYTVTGTDGFGCINTYTIGITVNPLPTVIATASLNSICLGDSTTLSASGAVNYVWTPNTALNTNVGPVVDAGPTSNITYTVTGTDGFGCVNTASISITVNPIPVVTVTPSSATVCFGDSVLLTAGGATTYSWSPPSGLNATTGTSVYAQPPNTTTYTVIGSNGNGCSASQNITVTVNPLPNVTALATPDIICFGQSSSITASGANTYTWSP
jgi:PKD repeat protein